MKHFFKAAVVALPLCGLLGITAAANELKLLSTGATSEGLEADTESIDRSVQACVKTVRGIEPHSTFLARWNNQHVVYDGTPEEEFAFRLCMHGMGYGPGTRADESYQDE